MVVPVLSTPNQPVCGVSAAIASFTTITAELTDSPTQVYTVMSGASKTASFGARNKCKSSAEFNASIVPWMVTLFGGVTVLPSRSLNESTEPISLESKPIPNAPIQAPVNCAR